MLDEQLENFVDGEFQQSCERESMSIIDPSTEEVITKAPNSTAEDVDSACSTAADAFEDWRRTTPAERSEKLLAIADEIEARSEEFVELEAKNTGKPIDELRELELPHIVDTIRFVAGAIRDLEGRASNEYVEGLTSSIRREPIGVCAQITPWNYPMMMAVWKWPAAVGTGNTVVLKPAETTPVTTLKMAELMDKHLPDGVFNVVCGDRKTGESLVSNTIPDMVAITGSVRAGREVMRTAADDVKRVHLELGGNAPVVVFDDVDIENTAEAIAACGYANAGQDCTAATRVLAAESIYSDFVAALSSIAEKKTTGGSYSESDYGPLNNVNQFERVSTLVENVPDHAKVHAGGSPLDRDGYFFEPTVISELEQSDDLVQEEIFGPAITVQPFDGEEDALRLANDTDYGLAASVWTENHGRAQRVSNMLDYGCVWINTHLRFAPEMPHGGFGHSGFGKDLSVYGVEDYTRIKHVMADISK